MTKFQKLIWDFYRKNKRDFPWRDTTDPYKIMVSELMLQQTQTFRVVPKYKTFIKKFPTIQDLADSQLSEVLELWSGLGYNRRARFLHQAAQYIVKNLNNSFPNNEKELIKIPGIGPYTAGAILVFSFNQPQVFIETNIRRVFIHHFFKDQENISDKQLFPLIEQELDKDNPRDWYYALMDYGVEITKQFPNPNRKSKHYNKQSKFEGSIRKIRGEILRQLIKVKTISITDLEQSISDETSERIFQAIKGLEKDNLINIKQNILTLQ